VASDLARLLEIPRIEGGLATASLLAIEAHSDAQPPQEIHSSNANARRYLVNQTSDK
jgi:hypothetical protein